jgi:hypothetical protein
MKIIMSTLILLLFVGCGDILNSESESDTSSSSEEHIDNGLDTLNVYDGVSSEGSSSNSTGTTITNINIENSENVVFNNTTQTFDDNNVYDSYNTNTTTNTSNFTDNSVSNNQQYYTYTINFDYNTQGKFYHETDADQNYGRSSVLYGIDKRDNSMSIQYSLDTTISNPWVKVVYDTEKRVDFVKYRYMSFKVRGYAEDFRVTFNGSNIAGYRKNVNSNNWHTVTLDLNKDLVNIFPEYEAPLNNYWSQVASDVSLINFSVRGNNGNGVVWIDDVVFFE